MPIDPCTFQKCGLWNWSAFKDGPNCTNLIYNGDESSSTSSPETFQINRSMNSSGWSNFSIDMCAYSCINVGLNMYASLLELCIAFSHHCSPTCIDVISNVVRHRRIGRAKRRLCTSDHSRLILSLGVVQQDEPCMMGVQPTACVNVEKKFTLLRGCTTNWKCGVYYHIILCMCIQV